MNSTPISKDEFAKRARRNMARAALMRTGKRPEYYEHYRAVLRETTTGGPAPRRMERRTEAAALLAALATAERTEQQIRTYPPAQRRRLQQRIIRLRQNARQGLRKLGYTNV